MTDLETVSGSSIEVVELGELKRHVRTNTDDDDTLLSEYGKAARQMFEAQTGRQIMTATYKLHLSGWPAKQIWFPRPPLQSVTDVKYYDTADSLQTLSASNYHVNTVSNPGSVFWKSTASLPSLSTDREFPVVATFVAGWASQKDVPALIRQGIRLLACQAYEQRSPIVTGTIVAELPFGFRSICWAYKTGITCDWNKV